MSTQMPTDTSAVTETIDAATGEIIVLSRHKAAAETKAAVAEEKVTPLAKPEKRKNFKERAKDKLKTRPAEDGTTPMTATAKSKAGAKSAAKAAPAKGEAKDAAKDATKAGKKAAGRKAS
ncbi:hypothetical protein [Undibacter mobilis]|uniref:Uncharacterized protein n=1 Tax=Undibacter mobilis TaxID=2292256 RepID=A0A371BCF1_9BRAD|nr:hypothetical protein [Undibacter mobilis]RDV05230.1 hypothetical protein DXH78_12015 [Undibacter mobilis]